MPKLKTRKSISARVKVTKNGKHIRRRAGQSHFNARDTGKTSRRKRRDFTISKSERKGLNAALPHS